MRPTWQHATEWLVRTVQHGIEWLVQHATKNVLNSLKHSDSLEGKREHSNRYNWDRGRLENLALHHTSQHGCHVEIKAWKMSKPQIDARYDVTNKKRVVRVGTTWVGSYIGLAYFLSTTYLALPLRLCRSTEDEN